VRVLGRCRGAGRVRRHDTGEVEVAHRHRAAAVLSAQALSTPILEEDAELASGIAGAMLVARALAREIGAVRQIDRAVVPTGQGARVEAVRPAIVSSEVGPVAVFPGVDAAVGAVLVAGAPLSPVACLADSHFVAETIGAAAAPLLGAVDALVGISTLAPWRPRSPRARPGLSASIVQATWKGVRRSIFAGSVSGALSPVAPLAGNARSRLDPVCAGAGPPLGVAVWAGSEIAGAPFSPAPARAPADLEPLVAGAADRVLPLTVLALGAG
jgi:hypothetical protein